MKTAFTPPMSSAQARALLPFFVNGTLGGPERLQLEALLTADAQLALELRWQRRIAAGVRAAAERADAQAGREPLQRLIDADRRALRLVASAAPASADAARNGAAGVWQQRARTWLATLLRPPVALAATAVAVIVLQGGVIVGLLDREGDRAGHALLRSAAVPSVAAQTFVRVMFKPGASEAETRAVLLQNKLRVVAGPSVLGEYWLWDGQDSPASPEGDSQALLARLRNSGVVMSAHAERRLPDPGQ